MASSLAHGLLHLQVRTACGRDIDSQALGNYIGNHIPEAGGPNILLTAIQEQMKEGDERQFQGQWGHHEKSVGTEGGRDRGPCWPGSETLAVN